MKKTNAGPLTRFLQIKVEYLHSKILFSEGGGGLPGLPPPCMKPCLHCFLCVLHRAPRLPGLEVTEGTLSFALGGMMKAAEEEPIP